MTAVREDRPIDRARGTRSSPAWRPRVVIVGAGFGGLEAAKALARANVEVTIVDQQNHHCFQPLLYQVATAALSPADIAWPIRGILRGQSNTRVVLGRVESIDTAARTVHTAEVTLPYDYLVVATGATHHYFGHDQWAPHAPGLKSIEDATAIRGRILLAFEKAELAADESTRRRLMTFAIIGGGPTGVEMAGAIAEIARQTLNRDFRRIDPVGSRIVLVEAGLRLLAGFPADLSNYARDTLSRMGVEVRTGSPVIECRPGSLVLKNEVIEAETQIWAAGVKASPAARWLRAPHDSAGRVQVEADLAVSDLPGVFVIGDAAAVTDAQGCPVPGIAPAAKQMGRYVGRLIAAHAKGRKESAPFRYQHYGDLATIGRKSAVVKLGRLHLTGVLGWLFWSVAHVYFLIGMRNRLVVAFSWLWSYVTFERGARLIHS